MSDFEVITDGNPTGWPKDLKVMHNKFGFHDAIKKLTPGQMKEFLHFRISCVSEENQELIQAYLDENPEEVVDALIDICVFAIGTLDAFGVDANKAWDAIFMANMAKQKGIKPERPNKFGFPDLLKPEGWVPPSHEGNHGRIPECFNE